MDISARPSWKREFRGETVPGVDIFFLRGPDRGGHLPMGKKIDACRRTANVHEFLRFAGSNFSTQRKRRRGQEWSREEKGIRRGVGRRRGSGEEGSREEYLANP